MARPPVTPLATSIRHYYMFVFFHSVLECQSEDGMDRNNEEEAVIHCVTSWEENRFLERAYPALPRESGLVPLISHSLLAFERRNATWR